jgi:hypothetical protein
VASAPNLYFAADTGSVDGSSLNVGDTIEIPCSIWIYDAGTYSNLKINFAGQEYLLDLPDGLRESTLATQNVSYTLQQPDFEADYGSNVGIATLTLTDSDGAVHTFSTSAYVRLENLPTQYALFFQFREPDWTLVETAFEILITPPFGGAPITVSENITLTRSGIYSLQLLSLSDGVISDETDPRSITAPPNKIGNGYTIDFNVHRMDSGAGSGGQPATDDFMDQALSRQKVGQPWSWS